MKSDKVKKVKVTLFVSEGVREFLERQGNMSRYVDLVFTWLSENEEIIPDEIFRPGKGGAK